MTTWNEILAEEMQKDYYQELQAFVQKEEQKSEYFLMKIMSLML